MAAKKGPEDPLVQKLDHLLVVLQNLFILQGLGAGMKVEDLRKILRIDKWRVTNISKLLKPEDSRGKRR